MENEITFQNKRYSKTYLKFTYLYSQTQVQEELQQIPIPKKLVGCNRNDQLIKKTNCNQRIPSVRDDISRLLNFYQRKALYWGSQQNFGSRRVDNKLIRSMKHYILWDEHEMI